MYQRATQLCSANVHYRITTNLSLVMTILKNMLMPANEDTPKKRWYGYIHARLLDNTFEIAVFRGIGASERAQTIMRMLPTYQD